jgi:hypothetical protein
LSDFGYLMVRLKQLYNIEETYPLTMTPFHFKLVTLKTKCIPNLFNRT